MTLVERVAHGLADEMGRHGVAREAVAVQELPPASQGLGLVERAVDLEVIAPAREFQAVELPAGGLLGQVREGQVSPLAREQCDGTTHRCLLDRPQSVRMTFAGTPATSVRGGTSFVTTAPAATTASSPTV